MAEPGGKLWLIAGLAALAAVGLALLPPLPQDPRYHEFADSRTLLGIPHFWNVVSNLPFLAVGLLGLPAAWSGKGRLPTLQTHYLLFFAGVFLTGLGSAYYHWQPDNQTLVWDRLPMTIAFMAFFALIIGEHIDIRAGQRLLWPLLTLGLASVWYWQWTEARGHGDLRPYAIVQFVPMLVIPLLLLLLPSRFSGTGYLWALLLAYGLAKVLEFFDRAMFEWLGAIGGHPLKHLAAALGAWAFCLALRHRCERRAG